MKEVYYEQAIKENGLDPFRYLTHIFKTAAGINLRENPDMVTSLLPENAPESCKSLFKPENTQSK
jgi:hypothetical protein